jgi:hypothetical protein
MDAAKKTDGGTRPDGCASVDCDDLACRSAGYSCTGAAVPAGWTLVAYSPDDRPVCPSGFEGEQAVVSDVAGGAASCSCVCGGGPAQCVGTTVYNGYYENSCSTGSGTTVNVNNGACSPMSTSLVAGTSYQLDQLGPEPVAQQATCTGSGSVVGTAPKPTFMAGATCSVGSPSALGCSAGAVCAPAIGSPFKECISHPGTAACPMFGYSKQSLVSTGSPGYVDGRGCGACPCATSLGCGATSLVTLFGGAGCTGSSYGIVIECPAAVGSSSAVASYQVGYSTSGSASCQPTGASSPTGSVTLDDHVETICCTE